MASDLPTDAQLVAITTIAQAIAWVGLDAAAWAAVDVALGNVPSLRILGNIPADALRLAVHAARVAVPESGTPGQPDHVPAAQRGLTVVESTQVGLLWRVARRKAEKVDAELFLTTPTPALTTGPGGVGTGAGTGPPAPAAAAAGPGNDPAKRKIKVSSVLDQADEAEVPELNRAEIDGYFKVLEKNKGGSVRPETEPSPEQVSALKVRLVDLDMSPYADFALFVGFQHRFAKSLKFKNHLLQPDGSFRTVEVPGPPNYDAWLASWSVFENALLMFEVKDAAGDRIPMVTQSALDLYRDRFRDLVVRYPHVWHLLVVAEDRCRAEHFPRLRRKLTEDHDHGLEPRFQPGRPWERVFRVAAHDKEYWDEHVRDPAIRFMASSKVKAPPGGTGSGTDLTEAQEGNRQKPPRKRRYKEKLDKQGETSGVPPPPTPVAEGKGGKGKGGKGLKRGRALPRPVRRVSCISARSAWASTRLRLARGFARRRTDGARRPRRSPGLGGLRPPGLKPEKQAGRARPSGNSSPGRGESRRRCGRRFRERGTRCGTLSTRKSANTDPCGSTWPPLVGPSRGQDGRGDGGPGRLRSDAKPEGWGPEAEEGNLLALQAEAFAEEQEKGGRLFTIEHPLRSYMWDLKPFKKRRKEGRGTMVVLDQCAFGAPHQKPTGLLTNGECFHALAKRCREAPKHTLLRARFGMRRAGARSGAPPLRRRTLRGCAARWRRRSHVTCLPTGRLLRKPRRLGGRASRRVSRGSRGISW